MPDPVIPKSSTAARLRRIALRVGSRLTTRNGVVFEVKEPVVLVSGNGAESPSLILERTVAGQTSLVVFSLGRFASHIGRAAHQPGDGARIDWAQARRRPFAESPQPQRCTSFGVVHRGSR